MIVLSIIKARLAAATPGPWHSCCTSNVHTCGMVWGRDEEEPVCTVGHGSTVRADSVERVATQEFIAHAPADIASLINEVEYLQSQVDRLHQALWRKCLENIELVAEIRERRGTWSGRVIVRYLPDGSRAFLPQVKWHPGNSEQLSQSMIDWKWVGPPRSGIVWDLPLDDEDIAADILVWEQVFGTYCKLQETIERMATWGQAVSHLEAT